MDFNSNTKKTVWRIFVFALAIFRLAWFIKIPNYTIFNSIYDDYQQLKAAEALMSGNWLGHYSYVTLIKGISFPLFVVLSNKLCIPYSMLLGLFYIGSAALFCKSLHHIAKNTWICDISFLLLIFSPAGFSLDPTQRLYRNAIIFPSVLLVIGCILMVYFSRKEKVSHQFFWLLCLGFSFSFFYYIREDSFWLLPLFIGSLIVIAIWNIWFSKFEKKIIIQRSFLLFLPIFIFVGSIITYKYMNYIHYGVSTTNDRTGGSFATLTGNMIKVEEQTDTSIDYWIPRSTMEAIVDECPSLKPHKDLIMNQYSMWADESGNVRGDWSVWAFREALSALGYYSDATTNEQFCKTVNNELLTAVNEGRLSFDNALHFTTQSRGIYWGEFPAFTKQTFTNLWNVLVFRDASAHLYESPATPEHLLFIQSITGANVLHSYEPQFTLSGWIIIKNIDLDNITLRVIDASNGKLLTDAFSLSERPDVQKAYPNEPNSLRSGFYTEFNSSSNIENIKLAIYSGDSLICTTNIEHTNSEDLIMHIERYDQSKVNYERTFNERIVALANNIIHLFRIANKFLLVGSLVSYGYLIFAFCKKQSWNTFEPAIILSAFLASLFILEFGITVFNSWLGAIWTYSCGVVSLGQVFIITSIAYSFQSIQKTMRTED